MPDIPKSWKATCFEAWERHLLGGRLHVTPADIESDRRKQKKTIRELIAAGYLTDGYDATSKAWDETPDCTPDLFQLWQDSRNTWNLHNGSVAPFVRCKYLLADQRKAVLADPAVRWWLVHENVTQYRRAYDERDDYLFGPFPLAEAVAQQKEIGKGPLWNRYELCVATDGVATRIRETLAAERFDHLYRTNLPWGLIKLGVLQEPEKDSVSSKEEPGWLLGSGARTDFGVQPERWGDKLAENVAACHAAVRRAQDQLVVLEQISKGVHAMGGWDVFRDKMAAALRDELAKQKEGS